MTLLDGLLARGSDISGIVLGCLAQFSAGWSGNLVSGSRPLSRAVFNRHGGIAPKQG